MPAAVEIPSDPTPEDALGGAVPGFGTVLEGHHRYRLMKRLGRGGFSSVYLARCLDADPDDPASPPERVAVKVIIAPRGGSPVVSLKRELAALLAIRHERVPRVYDWQVDGDFAFVAMEHFPDGSLRDVMLCDGLPDEDAVWRLLGDLLEALTVAHQASILHLDIKPSNVLIDRKGGYVLADFGVSEASRISRGVVRRSKGTPGYRAPEQGAEEFGRYDARTDLWGVGATVWSFATGEALSSRNPMSAYAGGTLPPANELREDLSEALVLVLQALLRPDPEDRPGSAAEFLARVHDLERHSRWSGATRSEEAGRPLSDEEHEALIPSLMDPLTASLCADPALARAVRVFQPGEVLCLEREHSHQAFLLLRGKVAVEREGEVIAHVDREGELLGEVASLTGRVRTASLYAEGTVVACVLNGTELEGFVAANPAMGVRLLRAMADRYHRGD